MNRPTVALRLVLLLRDPPPAARLFHPRPCPARRAPSRRRQTPHRRNRSSAFVVQNRLWPPHCPHRLSCRFLPRFHCAPIHLDRAATLVSPFSPTPTPAPPPPTSSSASAARRPLPSGRRLPPRQARRRPAAPPSSKTSGPAPNPFDHSGRALVLTSSFVIRGEMSFRSLRFTPPTGPPSSPTTTSIS